MARRKMGASETETILLVGGGLLLVYLFMHKPTTTLPPPPMYPGTAPQGTNTTSQAITAGAGVLNNLINQIFS